MKPHQILSHQVAKGWMLLALASLCLAVSAHAQTADGFNPGANGSVYALTVQTDGKIVVGGAFTSLGGQTRTNIGRLNADGTLDAAFNPGASYSDPQGSSAVHALAVQADGKILVGGSFDKLSSQTRWNIGRLNADGTPDSTFNIYYGAWGPVNSLIVQTNGKILVGGVFGALAGQAHANIGRLNADGTLDTSFNASTSDPVTCLAMQPDGRILVGGYFTNLCGQSHYRIGRLNGDGTLDNAFNATADSVLCLAVQPDNKILVGGSFTTLNGQPCNYLGRLNSDGTLDAMFNSSVSNTVFSLIVQADGRILIAGFFWKVGNEQRIGIARLNADGSLDTSFNAGANATVWGIAMQADGGILVGGSFTTLGGTNRSSIGRLYNTDPAIQDLSFTDSTITWSRGGTGPEVWQTTFEFSTNGTSWISLGSGARIAGGWRLSGVSVPHSAAIRARGFVAGGMDNASSWFVETMSAPPVINNQPVTRTNNAGTVATFSVLVGGTSPLGYQWRKGGVTLSDNGIIAGVHTSTLTLSNVLGGDAAAYSVIITNSFGSVTSLVATLSVIDPFIAGQPVSYSADAGETVSFTVSVVGTTPLTCQWLKGGTSLGDGGNISGAHTTTLRLNGVSIGDAGSYSVIISNSYGSVTSLVAALNVQGPPIIAAQPTNQMVIVGADAAFNVLATGPAPLSYQWLKEGIALSNGGNISGATNAVLVVSTVGIIDTGGYAVVVTDSYGAVTSQVARLSVVLSLLYVSQTSIAPTAPYTNWMTAAHTIQDAVDAAVNGSVVLVTNGLYATGGRVVYGSLSNRVALYKAVTVQSVNGPTVTIIQGAEATGGGNGDDAIRCAYVGTNALLTGFTLTNGHTQVSASIGELSGGGAFCELSGTLSNCCVLGNSADRNGAGVNGGKAYYCILSGNTSGYMGGGSYNCALEHCNISNNSADGGGGAAVSSLYDCTVMGNRATSSGGGADMCSLTNSVVAGNSSALDAGGVISCDLYWCAVTNNTTARYAGGTYGGTLYNCLVAGNSAGVFGGGSFEDTLYNCAVTGNSASSSGGTEGSTLYNCTVTGNSASSTGGAYGGTLYNCIVYFNSALTGGSNFDSSTLYFSCTTPMPSSGSGNITNAPQLASTIHLSAGSPCIGAGSAAYASGVDIDGEPWLNPPCIGADQYVSGSVTGALAVTIEAPYTTGSTGFTVPFSAIVNGRVEASVWDFGDGTLLTNTPFASHAWNTSGTYTVTLTAYNESYPQGVVATYSVNVVQQPVYYVNQNNATPGYPYSSWQTAATQIQDAINAGSLPGRLVLVASGTYNSGGTLVPASGIPNRVALTDPVIVRSVNGPGTTTIQGGWSPGSSDGNGPGAVRCVFVGNSATLTGFTLTGGHTDNSTADGSGGGVLCDSWGTISNCVITGNSSGWLGGGAFSGTLQNCTFNGNSSANGGGASSARLYNCIVTNNSAISAGGGAEECTAYLSMISNNYAYEGGGASWCTLYDCTLYGNGAYDFAGGAEHSYMFNCILDSNSCDADGGGAGQCWLYGCKVTHNSAGDGGGVSGGTLYNCLVISNSASFYGGGAVDYASLNNCTIVRNSALIGGGVQNQCALTNCIVYFNTAPNGPNYADPANTFSYCCTTPAVSGVGNISQDPAFANMAGGDFHLTQCSPCIDTGFDLSSSISVDIDRNPRPLDGNGNGVAAFDMGAYEFVSPTPFPPVMLPPILNGGQLLLRFATTCGASYTLQYTESLSNPTWQSLQTISGDGNVKTIPVSISGSSQHYYRLKVQ